MYCESNYLQKARSLKTFLIVLFTIITLVDTARAETVRDGISFYTLQDVRQGKVKKCALIPGDIGQKIYNHNNAGPPLSESEYIALAGNTEIFALQGDHEFYSRKAKRVLPMMEAYITMLGYDINDPSIYQNPEFLKKLQSFTPDKMPGDIPVLCGDGRIEEGQAKIVALKRAEKEEYERNCKLCKLPGGYYLEAIYEGDFKKQDTLAKNYLNQVLTSGGSEVMALGMLINGTGGQGSKFTYLEDVIGYYMLSTSRKWNGNPQCYPAGAHKVTFTTEYPDQVYETLGGVYLGRDEGYTKITKYTVNPSLKGACDKICNKNGGILLTARLAEGSGNKMDALEVFKGIDQMLSKHSCNDNIIKTFEKNLITLWEKEKSQPQSVRRNTIFK
tara:strand:+ start:10595 stop:11758 length:1164 start_codon:yes stop_codon:yes gene_type:complete